MATFAQAADQQKRIVDELDRSGAKATVVRAEPVALDTYEGSTYADLVISRRTFGALIAAGTPVRMLGRVLRTEAALPALGAGAGGIAVGMSMLTLFGADTPVVISGWIFAPVAIGVAVAVLAASTSGPMLRRISTEPITDE
ncbi:FtsX-like permease family protein [Saccharopolyspora hattusasensis]|uniref:FtsX-like permease family protein n=1 Tax=Saccharopolyspora hattusasensis TaxID=1128679 RepID=UPI003D96952C